MTVTRNTEFVFSSADGKKAADIFTEETRLRLSSSDGPSGKSRVIFEDNSITNVEELEFTFYVDEGRGISHDEPLAKETIILNP